MPLANYSENKVRVVLKRGQSHPVGLINPVSGMPVAYGISNYYIVALDSGRFQVSLALTPTSGIVKKAYPHDLTVEYATATGVAYGYPNSNGSKVYGHNQGILLNGSAVGIGTGVAEMTGKGTPITFPAYR